MNNNDLFVIILIVCSFSINLDDVVPTKVEAQDTFFLAASEGMVAMQVADTSTPEQVVPQDLCKCAGKGYIQFPDGNKTKCQCGDNCDCKKTNDNSTGSKPIPAEKSVIIPRFQIYEFTAKSGWCAFCNLFSVDQPNMPLSPATSFKNKGWGVDEKVDSLIRVFDVDKNPPELNKFSINPKTGNQSGYPFFVMLVDGKEVERIEGYSDNGSLEDRGQKMKKITDMFYKYHKR